MSIADEFIRLLHSDSEGVADSRVKEHFGENYQRLDAVINDMIAANRLQLYTQASGMLWYRIIEEETAIKFEGLAADQMLVYQVIERSGNRGAWTRDIKITTNIQQQVLTKTLKILEQRKLIKSVRSVVSKSKKLYMLFELEPAKEVSGGPWYTDQEFDHEYLELLSREIVTIVRQAGIVGVDTIAERVRVSGVSKVELTRDELQLVLQTLVYDGRLEEASSTAIAMTKISGGQGAMYKVSKASKMPNNYTSMPCGLCPLVNQCREGGVISPSTCEYMAAWLSHSSQQLHDW